jgi:hypothetical protein
MRLGCCGEARKSPCPPTDQLGQWISAGLILPVSNKRSRISDVPWVPYRAQRRDVRSSMPRSRAAATWVRSRRARASRYCAGVIDGTHRFWSWLPPTARTIAAGALPIRMLDRERLKRLIAENLVPLVGLRSADAFQGLFPIIGNDRSGLLVVADRFFALIHQVLMPECLLLAQWIKRLRFTVPPWWRYPRGRAAPRWSALALGL